MLWKDVQENAIEVVQQKTDVKLRVPIHSDLAAILTSCEGRVDHILKTSFGKPFAVAGFGNFMADRIGEAGLPGRCVTHGLLRPPPAGG